MKINVNKKSEKLLGLAAVLMLAAMVLFTGCPNAAGGNSGGSITPPASVDKTYTRGYRLYDERNCCGNERDPWSC